MTLYWGLEPKNGESIYVDLPCDKFIWLRAECFIVEALSTNKEV